MTKREAQQTSFSTKHFSLGSLDPVSLRSEGALESAIGILESHLQFLDEDKKANLLDDLLEFNNCFEFVMAVLSDEIATSLVSWILQRFPTQVGHFLSSPHSHLLVRLSAYFQDLPKTDGLIIDDTQLRVQKAQTCLRVLHEMSSVEDGSVFVQPSASKRKKRKETKNVHQSTNARILRDAGFLIPCTKSEAVSLQNEILLDQKHTLQSFFSILRKEQHRELFKGAYLGSKPETIDTRKSHKPGVSFASLFPTDDVNFGQKHPSTDSHNDRVPGFGAWKVLLSNRADGELRFLYIKDYRFFGEVLEAIKKLSQGRFTDTSQSLLTSPKIPNSIYRIEPSRNVHMLYHIHCTHDCECGVVHQVLRILTVSSPSNINPSFWNSVATVLARTGPQYQLRCSVRVCRPYSGGTVFSPASFPSASDSQGGEETGTQTSGDVEFSAELHNLLSSENFHHLSQDTLQDILINREPSYLHTNPQQRIPQHPSSFYVLDQNAAGTTTTTLFKFHSPPNRSKTRDGKTERIGDISSLFGSQGHPTAQKQTLASVDDDTPTVALPTTRHHDTPEVVGPKGRSTSLQLFPEEQSKVDSISSDIEEVDFSNLAGFVTQPQTFTETSYTDIHDEAAKVVQRTVRRLLLNHLGNAPSTLESRRLETYRQYLQASKYMVWLSRKYKHIFLGALPHLLLCIRETRRYVREQKAELRKNTLKGFVSDATALSLSEIAKLLKETDRLVKDLEPESDVHWQRDWERIREAAQQVFDTVNHLPIEVSDHLKNDLEIGYNATIKGLAQLALEPKSIPGAEEVGEPVTSSNNDIEEEYDIYEPQQFW